MDVVSEVLSTSEIAGAALELLKSQQSAEKGMYLSRLGGLLSAHFNRPTREIFGSRKLSQILTEGLGGAIKIEGSGASLSVHLVSESEMTGSVLRFDPVIWAAFSKPASQNRVKYLKVTRPFTFVSDPTKITFDDYKEVSDDDIADKSLPKTDREREIIQKIDNWCQRHNLQPADFRYEPERPRPQPVAGKIAADNLGLLRRLVEAIPPERRRDFSLSFDLIYELLDK
ncbi:hypothetical protein FY133_00625 [Agrobacterium tumefaciens]|uniref:hypothetical protein n=1 Tax=Agrobacterium tumefaciens TaxID=358 RepID=UPI0021D3DB98|nr:hypothetical protein [Agrobacterium tumefaciens]UXT64155.1 hypothetical protein FY133_00625 [Agrobacterium tumefaciens]